MGAASIRRAIPTTRSFCRFDHFKCWQPARPLSNSSSHRPPISSFGIAFDIDGVLLRGGEPIEGATQALRKLYRDADSPSQAQIPFIFLTNGGGVRESVKAAELSNLLGVRISAQQVLLGHTTFKGLVDRFRNAHILAVGKGEPAHVMVEYGYRNAISMEDYVMQFENIDPLVKYKHWSTFHEGDKKLYAPISQTTSKPVDAVFIVSDPVDWGRDIQVLCDVLRSGGCPGRRTGAQPPIFFAADDFEYQAGFPVERLGMGAFRIALENIYNRIGSRPFVYTSFGKPNIAVFRNAEQALKRLVGTPESGDQNVIVADQNDNAGRIDLQSSSEKCTGFKNIYMIGDNPATDIQGAREAGRPWFTILTRTGCFKGKENDEMYPADQVVEGVQEAIDFILKKHDTVSLSQV